jgi:tetratricopeptide (TPR) repeat protein
MIDGILSKTIVPVDQHSIIERVIDVLIAAVLCLAPLVMGGRHPAGRFLYVALVGVLIWTILLRGILRGSFGVRWSGFEPVLAAGTIIVSVQCMPLAASLVSVLSPYLSTCMPLWQQGGGEFSLGRWKTLSLAPHETRLGLSIWLAHGAFFLTLYHRLVDRHRIRQLLRWIAIGGMMMASLSLLQYLFGNGKFLWVYQNPYRDTHGVLRGTFYNENHLAHFLLLTLVPIGFCAARDWLPLDLRPSFVCHRTRRTNEWSRYLFAGMLPLVILAILLTGSRGGILVSTIVAALAMAQTVRREKLHPGILGGMVAMSLLIAAALVVHGAERVGQEVGSLASVSLDEIDQRAGRRRIWQAALSIIANFRWSGTGIGSFRDVFPLFYAEPRQHSYSYAESGYLHLAAETGIAGLLVLGIVLLQLITRLSRLVTLAAEHPDHSLAWALLSGLIASVVHSVFDFVWFLPGCFALTLALAAAALRLSEMQNVTSGESPPYRVLSMSRWHTILATGTVTVVVLMLCRLNWGPMRAESYWNAYLIAAEDHQQERRTVADSPTIEQLTLWRAWLGRAVLFDPHHARARLQLASIELQLFELLQTKSDNPMSLIQIRDAALASAFSSVDEQDAWVNRVVERRRQLLDSASRHAWRALADCPLNGMGYIYLAELAFLHQPGRRIHEPLIQQALAARPHQASVQFAAGREAILDGDLARTLEWWRKAYHQDEQFRLAITLQLAGVLPASAFIEQFQPDVIELNRLYGHYQALSLDSQAREAGACFVARAVAVIETSADAHLFQLGYEVAASLSDTRALSLARRAVELDPLHDTMRRRLGLELMARGEWDEALLHLQHCLDRNPVDVELIRKVDLARQQQRSRWN